MGAVSLLASLSADCLPLPLDPLPHPFPSSRLFSPICNPDGEMFVCFYYCPQIISTKPATICTPDGSLLETTDLARKWSTPAGWLRLCWLLPPACAANLASSRHHSAQLGGYVARHRRFGGQKERIILTFSLSGILLHGCSAESEEISSEAAFPRSSWAQRRPVLLPV